MIHKLLTSLSLTHRPFIFTVPVPSQPRRRSTAEQLAVLNLERRSLQIVAVLPQAQPAQVDELGDGDQSRGRHLSDDRDTGRHAFGSNADSVVEALSTQQDGQPDRDDVDDGDDIIEVPWPRRPEASSIDASVNQAFQDDRNI